MAVHQGVEGLKCSFEQCNIECKKLSEIRDHIREAHSVKNPVFGSHFKDLYNDKPSIDESIYDPREIDLAQIYEGLDIQIDNDVLGKAPSEKIKIKIKGKKERKKMEDTDEEIESDKDIKDEPVDDDDNTH